MGDRVEMGDCESEKLMHRGSLSVPVLSIFGKERWFPSVVEAGDAERGESMKDMLRVMQDRSRAGVSLDEGEECE